MLPGLLAEIREQRNVAPDQPLQAGANLYRIQNATEQ